MLIIRHSKDKEWGRRASVASTKESVETDTEAKSATERVVFADMLTSS